MRMKMWVFRKIHFLKIFSLHANLMLKITSAKEGSKRLWSVWRRNARIKLTSVPMKPVRLARKITKSVF